LDDRGKSIEVSEQSARHDVDDDSLAERDLYESPDPMILIRKMINKGNKELTR
jgi:hypothetical protein